MTRSEHGGRGSGCCVRGTSSTSKRLTSLGSSRGERRATSIRLHDGSALLILDLDGPILDVSERYYAAHLDALAAVDDPGTSLDVDGLWRVKRRRGKVRELLVDGGKETEYLRAFRGAVEQERLLELDRLHPGALEAVASLVHFLDVRVVSLRTNEQGARLTVERLGITPLAPVEFVPHGPVGKSARVAEIAADFESVIVVGDTEADAAAAERAHAPFVGVSCGIRDARLLSAAGAALVLPDLPAFAHALEHDGDVASRLGLLA